MLLHHPNRTLTHFRGKLVRLVHSSIFSRVGASSKPGAVQFNNYFYSTLFTIRRGKRGIRKYYVGWDTYLSLSGGNIRYLLELVHSAFVAHLGEERKANQPISFETQTKAAEAVGKKNLAELEGLSSEGGKLTKLLLSLGRAFQVMASDPHGHTPEINQFRLSDSDVSTVSYCRAKKIVDNAVMHLALVRSTGTKPGDASDTKDHDYSIHPVFSPLFVYSHRKKRCISISSETVLKLVDAPKEGIREVLAINNRCEPDDLPDQLMLFGDYYAGT